ncbi:MAG: tetratricopeptide repeat protein [Nitrospirota bacterium]
MRSLPEFPKRNKGILFILICTAAVYSNSLLNGFVWDDNVLLIPNKAYQTMDIGKIFLTRANSLEYLPFRDLTYAIDSRIWGMKPFGFHLSNLLLYLISLLVLFKMVKNMAVLSGKKEWEPIAFWTTLIYALHPLHSEVVNFIHGRNAVLSSLFLFMSFNACIEGLQKQRNSRIFISALLFFTALFSKASAVFFPLFIAVVFYLFPSGLSGQKKAFILTAFILIGLASAVVHFRNAMATGVMDVNFIKYGTDNWTFRTVKALQIPFFYLRMFFVPYPLNLEYHVSFISGLYAFRSVLAGAVIASMIYLSWIWRKRYPLVTMGVAWFFLSLGPVLNIFPTNPVVADRYAFLSVLGFSLITAHLISKTAVRGKQILILAAGVLVIWAVMDVRRNMDWRSDVTLWRSEIASNPDADRLNLSNALWNEGRYEEALSNLSDVRDFRYYQYMGRYLSKKGNYNEAIIQYNEALLRGGDAWKEVYLELAMTYEKAGFYAQALEEYLKASETKGADPLESVGMTAKEGADRVRERLSSGLEDARHRALSEPSNFRAQADLAISLHRLGLYEEAETFYKRAINVGPASWQAWYNLGLTFMKRDMYTDAINSFEKSLQSNPQNKDALNNMGICYMNLRDYKQAVQYYEKALTLDPGYIYAAFNLGRVYFIKGDGEMSKKYFLAAKKLAEGNNTLKDRVDQYLVQIE